MIMMRKDILIFADTKEQYFKNKTTREFLSISNQMSDNESSRIRKLKIARKISLYNGKMKKI